MAGIKMKKINRENVNLVHTWLRSTYYNHKYGEMSRAQQEDQREEAFITVQDFLNISATGKTDPSNSWQTDDMIFMSLLLLPELKPYRNNMYIMSPSIASKLAAMAAGNTDEESFRKDFHQAVAAIGDEDTRWIIIPCCDQTGGDLSPEAAKVQPSEALNEAEQTQQRTSSNVPLVPGTTSDSTAPTLNVADESDDSPAFDELKSADKDAQDAEDVLKDKQEDKTDKITTESLGVDSIATGSHWGFGLIDKDRGTATWFDSLVEVEEKGDGRKVKDLSPMASRAWAVLSGYETIAGRKFRRSAPKWLPHQSKDNLSDEDGGSACGPWVVAMIQYIFDFEYATGNQGWEDVFAQSQQELHGHRINFNSRDMRAEMQKMIQEAAEKNLKDDVLPFRLTRTLMGIFESAIDAESIRSVVQAYKEAMSKRRSGQLYRARTNKSPQQDDDADTNNDGNDHIGGGDDYEAGPEDNSGPQTNATEKKMRFLTRRTNAQGQTLSDCPPDFVNMKRGVILNTDGTIKVAGGLRDFVTVLGDKLQAERKENKVKRKDQKQRITKNDLEWTQRAFFMNMYGQDLDQLSVDVLRRCENIDGQIKKDKKKKGESDPYTPKETLQILKNRIAPFEPVKHFDLNDPAYYPQYYLCEMGFGWYEEVEEGTEQEVGSAVRRKRKYTRKNKKTESVDGVTDQQVTMTDADTGVDEAADSQPSSSPATPSRKRSSEESEDEPPRKRWRAVNDP